MYSLPQGELEKYQKLSSDLVDSRVKYHAARVAARRAVVDLVKSLLERISMREVSRRMDKSSTYLSQVVNGKLEVSDDCFVSLVEVLAKEFSLTHCEILEGHGSGRVPQEMLDWIDIGNQCRVYREVEDMGLRSAATHYGMLASELSDIECGKVNPTDHAIRMGILDAK